MSAVCDHEPNLVFGCFQRASVRVLQLRSEEFAGSGRPHDVRTNTRVQPLQEATRQVRTFKCYPHVKFLKGI